MAQVTILVWLMLKALVICAIPGGGELLWNGCRRAVSKVDAFIIADPFFSIHTEVESSLAWVAHLDMLKFILAISTNPRQYLMKLIPCKIQ